MSHFLYLILILNLWSSKAEGVTAGSRSILRDIGNNQNTGEHPIYAVELNATNFDAVLKDTPATYSIVEFFAHWCPACRNYKPHYEKVARLFNGPDAVHPGIILMTRVDCALKVNNKLCDRFSVSHYPMLFWAPPAKFINAGWDSSQAKSGIRSIDDGRTADRLLTWINKQLGSSYNLDDEKFENEHLQSNTSDPGQIARAVYDVEEATATAFEIILDHKMIKPETRASLIRFLQLLVVHHPSRRCRKGSAEVLVNFDDLNPSDTLSTDMNEVGTDNGKAALGSFKICGKDVTRGYWMFCRGSRNDTRGFSCGLWVLMHSLSVRIDDGESQFAFTAICDFIHNFFVCEECRQHFYSMCSRAGPFSKSRDFALWLWTAHNEVNDRLKKEEASLNTGDPKFPKTIWPPQQLCPSCYRSEGNSGNSKVDWNQDDVYKFLSKYYGKTLVSLYKEKGLLENDAADATITELVPSTNAVMVPVGAALAIAVASCAFGALACYWRSHQKNRKPRRSWN